MSTLSQFFGSSIGAAEIDKLGSGDFKFINSSQSVTIPSTVKYAVYGVLGGGGGAMNFCCHPCSPVQPGLNAQQNHSGAGAGFSYKEVSLNLPAPISVCATVGAAGSCGVFPGSPNAPVQGTVTSGGTSCVTSPSPAITTISATGGQGGQCGSTTLCCCFIPGAPPEGIEVRVTGATIGGAGTGGDINSCGGNGGRGIWCCVRYCGPEGPSSFAVCMRGGGGGAGGMLGPGGHGGSGGQGPVGPPGCQVEVYIPAHLAEIRASHPSTFFNRVSKVGASGGGGSGSGGGMGWYVHVNEPGPAISLESHNRGNNDFLGDEVNGNFVNSAPGLLIQQTNDGRESFAKTVFSGAGPGARPQATAATNQPCAPCFLQAGFGGGASRGRAGFMGGASCDQPAGCGGGGAGPGSCGSAGAGVVLLETWK
jgi:hypothetical protein